MDWQGRSGALYALSPERLESFVMREADLYVVARDGRVLWVGSTDDLVTDPASRDRFRTALGNATGAFRLDAPPDRNAAIWDLEQAMPLSSLPAQAA